MLQQGLHMERGRGRDAERRRHLDVLTNLKNEKSLCSWIVPMMGDELTVMCACVCVCVSVCLCAISKEETLQLKPFRGALSA